MSAAGDLKTAGTKKQAVQIEQLFPRPFLMVTKTAILFKQGQDCGVEANTGKYLAAEAAFEACHTAMLTHGGMDNAQE